MRAERGFVLLEAVVALLIVSVFATATLAALGARLRGAATLEDKLLAKALAEERFAVIETLSGIPHPLPDSIAEGTFAAPYDDYVWTASVEAVRGEENLYEVLVLVESNRTEFTLRGRLFRPPASVGGVIP